MNDKKIFKSCMNKRRYKTKENALNFFKKIKKSGAIVPPTANAYYCPYCFGWHTGHSKERN